MNKRHLIAMLSLTLLLSSSASAQEEEDGFPRYRLSAYMDTRYVRTDTVTSWLERGTGKFRYGGENGEEQDLLRLGQASVLFSAAFTDVLSARVHLNIDTDRDDYDYRKAIDVVEGFVSYRPVLSPRVRLSMRGGMFFPPVSLENTALAWTSPYTITSSSINSWIGEEVRIFGGEFNLVLAPESQEIILGAAFFGNNDPTGSLLAWRGWALHDRQTALSDKLPLAPIPAIQPEGLFPHQAPYVQPFREIDGKVGYYVHGAWSQRFFELRTLYYDNRAEPTRFDGWQYAWGTRFLNIGASVPLPWEMEIISQYMWGKTRMGWADAVHADFYAIFFLLTKKFGPHRVTVRYDDFYIEDIDRNPVIDNNEEYGKGWTFAYLVPTGDHHQLALEVLRVDADREVRPALHEPENLIEVIVQASFRLHF